MSNDNQDNLKFAYWVPNVSGGLVVSKIEQRTDWGIDYNRKLARLAEDSGFAYALSQVRYMASYGAEYQHESTGFSLALLLATERLKVIAAIHPGLWHPAVLAKVVASADVLSNGRAAVNVVSGWFKGEFTALGEPWLEHDERYRRSEEFIRVLRGSWTEDHFAFKGDFYRINGYNLKPKPLQQPGPEIFQGGNSKAARQMAARVSDWYFMNGNSLENVKAQVDEVKALAGGRPVRFGLNAFIIVRETEKEAKDTLREIIEKADVEAVNGFGEAVKQAGKSTQEKQGMWANSTFEDLVQYNDGFRTGLIGTPEQVAERIVAYKEQGANLILGGFLHYLEEVELFGKRVVPLVRQLEAARARRAA
jgi:FMNH2-dependent dimethyl sulfone monooxygenase